MKLWKTILLYVVSVTLLCACIFIFIHSGKSLEVGKVIPTPVNTSIQTVTHNFWDDFKENLSHPLSILLLQVITIIFVARTFGYLFNKIGQPTVIGEIVAGIFLGPSLLGMFFPQYSNFLFPVASLNNLKFLSQIGLILFMFVIGMELDLKIVKARAQKAILISHISVAFSYACGVILAYTLYQEFAPKNVSFLPFALFMGIAMSITAFPVLARIIQERGLTKTKLGMFVITCAAIEDITAWCLLATVIAIVKAGDVTSSLFVIGLTAGYVLIMIFIVHPFLKKIGEVYSNKESVSLSIVSLTLGVLFISAYTTEVIGIHALIGAFMAGLVMPQNTNFRKILIDKVEHVSVGLLLPLFFVLTGLRTQIGLLNEGHLWATCSLIIAVAVFGKLGGTLIVAKILGKSWRESLIMGAFMNTRGLMELVVLNIGYDLGLLSPEIFAMMVLMALGTTFMTGPLLDLIEKIFPEKIIQPEAIKKTITETYFRILISFANPQSGKRMIRLAKSLMEEDNDNSEVTALHVSPSADINLYEAAEFEKESFKPIKGEAQRLDINLKTQFKASNDVSREVLETANSGNFDLLIVGVGQSIFQGSILGRIVGLTAKALNPEKLISTLRGNDKILESKSVIDNTSQEFIDQSEIPVAIFLEKDFSQIEQVILPIVTIGDLFLLLYAKRIIKNNAAQIKIVDLTGTSRNSTALKEEIQKLKQQFPKNVSELSQTNFNDKELESNDLMLISYDSWKKVVQNKLPWVEFIPSTVIVRP